MTEEMYQREMENAVAEVLETCSPEDLNELAKELQILASYLSFSQVAVWTKIILRKPEPPKGLLTAFANAFSGDQVGLIGQDMLLPLLGHSSKKVREEALSVLGIWCENDLEGTWYNLLENYHAREKDNELRSQAMALIEVFQEDGFPSDCPECGEGLVMPCDSEWYCNTCGELWLNDPREDAPAVAQNEDENSPWFQVRRQAKNSLKATVRTEEVPALLQNVLGIHTALSIDFIESIRIQHLSTRSTTLGLELLASKEVLRGWDEKSGFAFSIEPDELDNFWLVCARWG